MSVATLDIKLDAAKKQSETLLKKQSTWQEKTDDLLDRMNELNGLLANVHSMLITLNLEIERDFTSFKDSEKAPAIIIEVSKIIAKLLIVVRNSDLYPGVKTIHCSLRDETRNLRELVSDRIVGINLSDDKEMNDLIDEFMKISDN